MDDDRLSTVTVETAWASVAQGDSQGWTGASDTSGVPEKKLAASAVREVTYRMVERDTISSLGVIDINKGRTGRQMGVSANCNAYFRSSAADPTWLTVWANDATNLIGAPLAEFTQTTGQESFGLYGEGPANPFITDLDGGDAGRPLGSSAIDSGDALPAAIAAAIGVPADGPVDIGVLRLG